MPIQKVAADPFIPQVLEENDPVSQKDWQLNLVAQLRSLVLEANQAINQLVDSTRMVIITVTGAYTVQEKYDLVLADATGGAFAVTLPTAVGFLGKRFTIKRISAANNVTVNTTSNQTIDGDLTQVLSSQWSKITVVSDNANWQVIA